jgi:predicted PurR-regulated permease PerM
MDSFEPAQISWSIFNLTAWERIGKFFVLNIVLGICIGLIIYLIVLLFKSGTGLVGGILIILFGFIAMISAWNAFLSGYEMWRGCNFVKNT